VNLDSLLIETSKLGLTQVVTKLLGKPKSYLCTMREDCAYCFDIHVPEFNVFYKKK